MKEVIVDVTRETCPVPLLEMRIALKEAEVGDTVIVRGIHVSSKREIAIAAGALGYEFLGVSQEGEIWEVSIKKSQRGLYE